MAANQMNLPKGFVLDEKPDVNLPEGFVLDEKPQGTSAEVDEIRANELIEFLGKMGGIPVMPASGETMPAGFMRHQIEQRKAYQELQDMGYDPQQLETILGVRKQLKPRYAVGRTTGGIAAPLAAPAIAGVLGQIPPFTALPEELVTIPLVAGGLAFLGGGTGEITQMALEGKKPTISDFAKAGGIETLYELGGRYIGLGAKYTIFSPFIKKTNPEAAYIISKYGKNALSFSPAELDKRLIVRASESISRGSFATQELWEDFAAKGLKGIRGVADQLTDTMLESAIRLPPDEAVRVFTEGLQPNGFIIRQVDDLFEPLYKQVDELAKTPKFYRTKASEAFDITRRSKTGQFLAGETLKIHKTQIRISTQSLKNFAAKQLALDNRLNKQFLSPEGRTVFNKIVGMDKDLSFLDYRKLLSGYKKQARKLARDADQSGAVIKQLVEVGQDTILDPKLAENLNPEARNLLLNTNKLYKAVYGKIEKTGELGALQSFFSERMAKDLARNPAKFAKALFPEKNPKEIMAFREALLRPIPGQPSNEGKLLWNQLRANWYADLLERVSKEEGLSKTSYYNAVHKMGDSLKEIFPEKYIYEGITKDVPTMLNLKRISTAAGTPLFSKGLQIGGAYKVFQGAQKGDVITILSGGLLAVGPDAYAKLATEPTGRGIKLLTAGFNIERGKTSQLIPITTRMINLLNEINKNEQKEYMKIYRQKQRQRWIKSQPNTYEELRGLRGFGGRGY